MTGYENLTIQRLRELAVWYRMQAERSENPYIWEFRIRTAEDIEDEISRREFQNRPFRTWL